MKRAGVPHRYLEGKNIVLLFEKTSTRTRCALSLIHISRAVAVPIDQALVLCAFVVLTASFVGWILALLPLLALVPVFRCV